MIERTKSMASRIINILFENFLGIIGGTFIVISLLGIIKAINDDKLFDEKCYILLLCFGLFYCGKMLIKENGKDDK
jgi:hypothetical protein